MEFILALVVVLGILIFFHELGHFLAAKLFGVGVEVFSLGFGPRLFGKKFGMTDYRISAFPLGGFVKMVGEHPDEEVEPDDIPISFTHKHVLKRMAIAFAGPFFNFVLAAGIYTLIFGISGITDIRYNERAVVGEVGKDTPSEKAGLQKGDQILSINGKSINSWDEMSYRIEQSRGNPLLLAVLRKTPENETRNLEITVTPELKSVPVDLFGKEKKRYLIGISKAYEVIQKPAGPITALTEGVATTWFWTKTTIIGLYKMVVGEVSAKNIGGPIFIAQAAGEQAKRGVGAFFHFIAFISINLAIVNLLPIPILDGGHLVFYSIELAKGSPVSLRARLIAQQGGLFVLIMIMIFAFYNDIMRFFSN